MGLQKKVKGESDKQQRTVKLEIETTEKVYELLKILAKKDRSGIKNYVATSLYLKMEGDVDYYFKWADNPERKKHLKTLKQVYPECQTV